MDPNTPANTRAPTLYTHKNTRRDCACVPVCLGVYEPIIINAQKAVLKMSELVSHPNLYATKSKHIHTHEHVVLY